MREKECHTCGLDSIAVPVLRHGGDGRDFSITWPSLTIMNSGEVFSLVCTNLIDQWELHNLCPRGHKWKATTDSDIKFWDISRMI